MKVLITGAGGSLGAGLAASLAPRHALRLSDVRDVETPHAFVRADIRRREEVLPLAAGMDVVVHTPAWHGIHLRSHGQGDFWDVNVDGTFNVLQSVVAHGVRRVVWISSMSVRDRNNIYGLSKVIGEELCAFYHRGAGVRFILLRPADFTPYPNRRRYGERLLRGGVDRRDVVAAAELAVEHADAAFEALPVLRQDPFTEQDVNAWAADPAAVLERHRPGAADLVRRYALSLPERIGRPDPVEARACLGYRPRYNFFSFLEDLAAHDAAGDAEAWLSGV